MSGIGWVDFSADDRHRVQQVIALLKEKGTLDELGIGQIRDAISDQLFPGLSTIQTRARYFVAVPKILLDWANQPAAKRRRIPLAIYLQDAENELARMLTDNYEEIGEKPRGVIGNTVIESGGVTRRPSSTYWNGLRTLGIVNTSKSLADFCREWGRNAEDMTAVEAEEGSDDATPHFSSEVSAPKNLRGAWPKGLTLDLNRDEAAFLAERFEKAKGLQDSAMAQLLKTNLAESVLPETFERFSAFSDWAAARHNLSLRFRRHMASAQQFSDAIEGAHIIYNRLLAEKLNDDDLREYCISQFKEWTQKVKRREIFKKSGYADWLVIPNERRIKINAKTCEFLSTWNEAMCNKHTQEELDGLVRQQATNNKPDRSLLIKGPGARANWYGIRELEYRWPTARRMLSDIVKGQSC